MSLLNKNLSLYPMFFNLYSKLATVIAAANNVTIKANDSITLDKDVTFLSETEMKVGKHGEDHGQSKLFYVRPEYLPAKLANLKCNDVEKTIVLFKETMVLPKDVQITHNGKTYKVVKNAAFTIKKGTFETDEVLGKQVNVAKVTTGKEQMVSLNGKTIKFDKEDLLKVETAPDAKVTIAFDGKEYAVAGATLPEAGKENIHMIMKTDTKKTKKNAAGNDEAILEYLFSALAFPKDTSVKSADMLKTFYTSEANFLLLGKHELDFLSSHLESSFEKDSKEPLNPHTYIVNMKTLDGGFEISLGEDLVLEEVSVTPTPTPTPDDDKKEKDEDKKSKTGLILGIVLPLIALLILGVIGMYVYMQNQKKKEPVGDF